MKFDVGMIVTIVFVLLFYMRLIVLQRGRTDKAKVQYKAAEEAARKKKNAPQPQVKWENVGVRVRNWWLIAAAIVLIVFGVVVYGTRFLGTSLSTAWWVPVNVGIVIFALAVK